VSNSIEKNWIGETGFNKRTICEVLREIYWYTTDETIREKIKDAMQMAKKMDAKLRSYKSEWDKNEWEVIPNQEEIRLERVEKYLNENNRTDVRKG